MVHISLAIGGLPDQHIVLRAGGLYWVTVDHSADAKLLARQFLEAIPESVPATLIASTGSVQGLVSDMAAGMGGISSEILALAGGENVVSDSKKLVRFSEEALIAADPDVYLIQQGPMNPAPTPLDERAHYKGLRAVREGRVLVVDEDRFARPGPRALDAAEELAGWLHR